MTDIGENEARRPSVSGRVRSRDGTEIAYDRRGGGPSLVVVHGATAFRAFDPNIAVLADLLADELTVVNFDRRGRGESGNTLPFAPEREIEDIAALIEGPAGGRASLLGFSSGSVLALEAAASGLPVDRLVMYEPPFVLPGSGFPPPPPDYVETLERLAASGDKDGPPAYFMRSLGTSPEAIDEATRSPIWPIMQSVGPTIAYDGRFMFDAYYSEGRFPDRWSRATMPVLVVNGDKSFPFMPMAADAVAKALPNATQKVLAGQDHGPKPDVFAPVIREFLTQG